MFSCVCVVACGDEWLADAAFMLIWYTCSGLYLRRLDNNSSEHHIASTVTMSAASSAGAGNRTHPGLALQALHSCSCVPQRTPGTSVPLLAPEHWITFLANLQACKGGPKHQIYRDSGPGTDAGPAVG